MRDLLDQLSKATSEPPIPRLEPITTPVASLSPHTMEQVEKDLRRWADEGCPYADEALQILREITP